MAKTREPKIKPTRRSERLQALKVIEDSESERQKKITKPKRFRRPKQRKSCKFLQLPGEIRNEIYRAALVGDPVTIMDVGPAQPSLLRVCKQIRKETTGIYYCENKFTIWIEEHNDAPFTNFVRAHEFAHCDESGNLEILMMGPPNWTNLLAWLKEYHTTKVFRPEARDDSGLGEDVSPRLQTVFSLFELADEFRWYPWAKVEKILEIAHKAITAGHSCWA